MASWRQALAKTRRNLAGVFSRVFSPGSDLDEDTLEELEETLVSADVSARLVQDVLLELEEHQPDGGQTSRERLRDLLVRQFDGYEPFEWNHEAYPYTILVVGVNGSGKTTTCAKLAYRILEEDKQPLLAAGDTFRAAGADQLKFWADRVGSEVVAGFTGGDAAAVAFDALQAAESRRADYLIIDTAGRMHTRKPLMMELEKVQRALSKNRPSAPEEVWIVLDASLGQNAILQARTFNEIIRLTGAVVAKLDGSSKGGFIFSIARELQVPIRYVGLGESQEDLVPFNPSEFVDALLGLESVSEGAPS